MLKPFSKYQLRQITCNNLTALLRIMNLVSALSFLARRDGHSFNRMSRKHKLVWSDHTLLMV